MDQNQHSRKGLIAAIVIIIILVLAGVIVWANRGDEVLVDDTQNVPAQQQEETGTSTPTNQTKEYTLIDVAAHNKSTDCWMAIEGKVYDVTDFVSKHPGGPAIVRGCGKDATVLFNTRPNGPGTPHPDQARAALVNFYIGELVAVTKG